MHTKLAFNSEYQEILRLPGGERIRLRLVRPGDKERLRNGFHNLSAVSRRKRFLGGKQALSDAELRYFTELDHSDHLAIGAVELDRLGAEQEGVAVGRFIRSAANSQCAEVAVTVIDRMQGKGIGRTLLEKLVLAAVERDIKRFQFECFSHNLEARKLVQRVCKVVNFVDDVGVTIAEVELPDPHSDSPQYATDAFERLFMLLRSFAADSLERQVNLGIGMANWTFDMAFDRRNYWPGS
jgi:GNAT superfamily N-acetyltransferase